MWHRKRRPELAETIETKRFLLRPAGILRALALHHRINDDPDILINYRHTTQKQSWLESYRSMPRPNGKSKFTHEIITKKDDSSIGFHTIRMIPYRSAFIGVVVLDKDYWGKGVPLEVRKVLLPLLVQSAGVERFCAQVSTRNFASVYNHQKLGFTQNGLMHQMEYDPTRDLRIDFFMFELLENDFPDYFRETKI